MCVCVARAKLVNLFCCGLQTVRKKMLSRMKMKNNVKFSHLALIMSIGITSVLLCMTKNAMSSPSSDCPRFEQIIQFSLSGRLGSSDDGFLRDIRVDSILEEKFYTAMSTLLNTIVREETSEEYIFDESNQRYSFVNVSASQLLSSG